MMGLESNFAELIRQVINRALKETMSLQRGPTSHVHWHFLSCQHLLMTTAQAVC